MSGEEIVYSAGWGGPKGCIDRAMEFPSKSLKLFDGPGAKIENLVLSGKDILQWPQLESFLAQIRTEYALENFSLHTDFIPSITSDRARTLFAEGLKEILTPLLILENRPGKGGAQGGLIDRKSNGIHLKNISRLSASGAEIYFKVRLGWPDILFFESLAALLATRIPLAAGIEIHKGGLNRKDRHLLSRLKKNGRFLSEGATGLIDKLRSASLPVTINSGSGLPFCLFHERPDLMAFFARGRLESDSTAVRAEGCLHCEAALRCSGIAEDWLKNPLLDLPRPIFSHGAFEAFQSMTCGGQGRNHKNPGTGRTEKQRSEARGASERVVWRGAKKQYRDLLPFSEYRNHLLKGKLLNDRMAISLEDYQRLTIPSLEGFRVTLAIGPGFEYDQYSDVNHPLPPLSLINLASMLRHHGCTVHIKNLFVDGVLTQEEKIVLSDQARLAGAVKGECDTEVAILIGKCIAHLDFGNTDLMGFSIYKELDLPVITLIQRESRRRGYGVPMVAGGSHVDSLPPELKSEIDYLIYGEGELPLLFLCRAIVKGEKKSWIPGIGYHDKKGGWVKINSLYHSLDIHPPPDLEGFNLNRYTYNTHTNWRETTIPYQFIAGCPHDCAFCNSPIRRKYKLKDPSLIGRDLSQLYHNHGVNHFFFLNNLFNVLKGYTEQVLDELIGTGIEWYWTDCCYPRRMTRETLVKMRRAGCDYLTWGLDTPSERLGKLYNKGLPREEVREILKTAAEVGIHNHVNLIAGMPHETEEDLDEIIQFLKANRKWIQCVGVKTFQYFSKSDMGLHPEKYGLIRRSAMGRGPGNINAVDELNGMTWEARQEWARYSKNKIDAIVMDLGLQDWRVAHRRDGQKGDNPSK